jgi:ribosomal protein S18 acetylase RimI-like enzyme
MSPGCEIREGGIDDLAGLETTWRSLHAHHRAISTGRVPFLTADERWPARLEEFRRAIADGSGMVLIAESEGEVVGFAFSTLNGADKVFASGPVGEVDVLVVAPERRGQGIGERLARRSLDLLRERGARTAKIEVIAGNEDALRFYERLGATPARVELLAPLHPAPGEGAGRRN